MKVLLTGAGGQVGRALLESVPADAEIFACDHAQLDIGDGAAVYAAVQAFTPDVIVNAAAYTAVDKAETEPERAAVINAEGPRYLSEAAAQIGGCRMIHVSTDYVFDGTSSRPYRPHDPTNPLSVYGRTKLEGEKAVLKILRQNAVVVRTSWVYGATGKNFLLTMLRLMRERRSVRVVEDQRGTPTATTSIARALWCAAKQRQLSGILHWTDAGTTTWYEFATAIAEEAQVAGLLDKAVTVAPITTADYPTAARRPVNSALETADSAQRLGLVPIPWRIALINTLQGLSDAITE